MSTFPLQPNVRELLNTATPGLASARLGDIVTTVQSQIAALESGASYTLPAAATGVLGGVTLAAAVPNSTAPDVATLVTNFNSLLTSLRASGVLHA